MRALSWPRSPLEPAGDPGGLVAAGGAAPGRSGLRGEAVPHPTHGLDDAVAELAAQVADVDVDDVGAGVEVVAPHVGEQLLAGQHLAGVAQEGLGQGELAGGEVDGAAARCARRVRRSSDRSPQVSTVVSVCRPPESRSRTRASSSSNRNGLGM